MVLIRGINKKMNTNKIRGKELPNISYNKPREKSLAMESAKSLLKTFLKLKWLINSHKLLEMPQDFQGSCHIANWQVICPRKGLQLTRIIDRNLSRFLGKSKLIHWPNTMFFKRWDCLFQEVQFWCLMRLIAKVRTFNEAKKLMIALGH